MGIFDSVSKFLGVGDEFQSAKDATKDITDGVGQTAKLMPWIVGGLAVTVMVAIILLATNTTGSDVAQVATVVATRGKY